jgi:type VI secretion system secreted protein VgrG
MSTFQLELKAAGLDLDLRAFEAHEGLNQPFLVSITGVSRDPDLDLDAAIGGDASFVVRIDGRSRTYAGIIRRFDQVSADEVEATRAGSTSLSTYFVEIVPKLWALGQTRNHRAFQDMSELDVALAVLEKWKIEPELRLDRARYRRREIRVQYGESDLDLFARLLEEIGVSYWFEPREDRTALVLGDAPHDRKPRPCRTSRWGASTRPASPASASSAGSARAGTRCATATSGGRPTWPSRRSVPATG